MDLIVLMDGAESKFKRLREEKLWLTNTPMKANMLAPTMVIGNLTRQLDAKEDVKQSNKYFGDSTPSVVVPGNNEKYNPPKPGELLTNVFGK